MPSSSTSGGPNLSDLPYDLRIGVTGHREIVDAAGIRQSVKQLLDHLDRTLQPQSRTPLKWTVVSPIAKGADRIVAEAVLGCCPATLEVLSPFELDEYRLDFEDGEDRDEFERLLNRARHVECLANGDAPDATENDEVREHWRNRGYLRVGRAVVDSCEILLAVWNGRDGQGVGGTADIVGYALRQQRTVVWIHADEPSRAPCLITAWQPGSEPQTRALPATAKRLSPGYHQLDAYNRDDRVAPDRLKESISEASRMLREQAQAARISDASIAPIIETLVPHYARADLLAVHYRDRYVRATNGLFLLSAIAVTVVVGQILFVPDLLWLILFEILAMGMAVGLWTWSIRAAWHEKWIHDRYLTERLRMAMFGLLLNQPQAAMSSAPSKTLAFYSGPSHWLLSTVGHLVAQADAATTSVADVAAVKRFLISAWLDDQRKYHARNSRKKHDAAHRGHRVGILLFLVTVVMATLHMAGVGHGDGAHHSGGSIPWDAVITFLAIVLPVWGAAMHAIITQLELDRIAARSKRMAVVLGALVDQAEEADTLDELRQVVLEGQRVMGTENHEWWILLSFREPVLPA